MEAAAPTPSHYEMTEQLRKAESVNRAAPEMLETLKAVLSILHNPVSSSITAGERFKSDDMIACRADIRAAIAKAEGRDA